MPIVSVPVSASLHDQTVSRHESGVYPPTANFVREDVSASMYSPQRTYAAPEYYVRNTLLRFPTGSLIPSGATVIGAALGFNVIARENTNTLAFCAGFYQWSGIDSDWTSTPETDAISGYPIASITNQSYNEIPLTGLSGISTSGDTYMRLHITQRAADAAPTGFNRVGLASFDHATLDPPVLLVEFTLATERLAPDAIISQTNLTGVVASIQDDPETPDANWLTTSDPSGQSGLTDGPRSPNANAAVSGFSGSFTNPANAYDGNTNTAATTTMGSNGQNHGGYFSLSSTAFAAIPSNAVIDSITVHANQQVSNNNRSDQFFQLGTANGVLIGNEVQLDATTSQTVDSVTGFTTMPTRAQLVSGTFGIRVRAVRSNTTTYSLYELTATVTYSIPAQTKNTEARVSFPSPSANLETG